MFYLIVQTILLMAIAFILGAVLGCLLRRWFGAAATPVATRSDRTVAAAGVGTVAATGAVAKAGAPHVPSAPLPEVEPVVVPQPIPAPATVPVPPVPAEADVPAELDAPVSTPNDADDASAGGDASAGRRSGSGKVAPETLVGAAGLVGGPVEDEPKAKTKRTDAASARRTKSKTPPKAKAPAKAKSTVKSKTDPAETGEPDNLKLIRGIGPQNESRLNAIGVDRFAQIAAWTKKDQREMGERLSFPGRIEREEWVAQAKQLAKGKATEFSARAGAGRVKTSTGTAATGATGVKPPLLEAARDGKPDNLTLIDGVGNAIERKLFKLGVFHFDQVAAWSEDEGVWISNEINFPGRVARENWIAEAKVFAEGGTTEHAASVERGQIKTSRKSTDGEK